MLYTPLRLRYFVVEAKVTMIVQKVYIRFEGVEYIASYHAFAAICWALTCASSSGYHLSPTSG